MRKVVQKGRGRTTDEKRSRSLLVFNSTQLIHLQSEKRDSASRPTRGDAAGAFTVVGSPKPAGLTRPARSHISESTPSSLCWEIKFLTLFGQKTSSRRNVLYWEPVTHQSSPLSNPKKFFLLLFIPWSFDFLLLSGKLINSRADSLHTLNI